MDFKLEDIVERKRDASAGYHLVVGRGWRLIGEKKKLHSSLAYAAFEYRCAIERCLFELFYLIRDKRFSSRDLKVSERFNGLVRAILTSEGGKRKLQRKMIFNRLCAKHGGFPSKYRPAIIDIGKMRRFWSKLSEYCHKQLEPKKTWESLGSTWVSHGYQMLNEVESYLWEVMVNSKIGWVSIHSIPPEVAQAGLDYVEGRITESALDTRMDLMAPILEKRFR